MDKKTLLAAALAALAVAPAFADKGGPHGRHGNGHDDGYHAACPPGLAKKHNGCLPPGQAKKVYRDAVVGHHVPPHAVYVVPRHVRASLPAPPPGYRYAVVNNQVVLVSSTDIVVEIIRSVLG